MATGSGSSTANVGPATSAARAPRALVRLGTFPGVIVPGWKSLSVSNNSYSEADTFRIEFAASALPASNNANWFSTQKEVFAEILDGFPQDPTNPQAGELDSQIYGRVDDIVYNPRDGLITVTGRDLTAAFIDSKISDQFQNQTSEPDCHPVGAGARTYPGRHCDLHEGRDILHARSGAHGGRP